MRQNMGRLEWILAAVAGAFAVGGVAYAASGGSGGGATTTPPIDTSGGSGGGTVPVTPQGGGALPGGAIGGATQLAQAVPATMVPAAKYALATVAAQHKIQNLSYTAPGPNDPSLTDATDATFTSALAVFQVWMNAMGGYMPPNGFAPVQVNTAGVLDMATFAALLSTAAQ